MVSSRGPEGELFDHLKNKDLDKVAQIIHRYPDLDLNCVDKDELTPLQHACHSGDIAITRLLIDKGADVNVTKRKDAYTSLMFAAISNKQDIVRLLLERGADATIENCVNRTTSQMAAFIGLFKVVYIINSWIPYEKSIQSYTECRELEDTPRIPNVNLGRLLHEYIVLPTLHPIKFLLFLRDSPQMIKYSSKFMYVLEQLCLKTSKKPDFDETLSLKYHYLFYMLQYCQNLHNNENQKNEDLESCFDENTSRRVLDSAIRKLIRRQSPEDVQPATPQINRFVLDCTMKFPYTHLGIYKTMTYAMNREATDHYQIFTQSLNGPHMFGRAAEACSICTEVDKCKKCGKCKSVYYCGSQCQLIDWFQHKKACKHTEEQPLLDDTDDNN